MTGQCYIEYDGAVESTADILSALFASGLTQTEIAKRTRIPQPRLSKWANGQVPRTADDALRLKELRLSIERQAKSRRA